MYIRQAYQVLSSVVLQASKHKVKKSQQSQDINARSRSSTKVKKLRGTSGYSSALMDLLPLVVVVDLLLECDIVLSPCLLCSPSPSVDVVSQEKRRIIFSVFY